MMVIMRHILEHCHDMPEVAAALKELVAADDHHRFRGSRSHSRTLEHLDYTTILGGTRLLLHTADSAEARWKFWDSPSSPLHSYPYTHENPLVAVVRPWPPNKDQFQRTDTLPCCRRKQRGPVRFPAAEFAATRANVTTSLREFSRGQCGDDLFPRRRAILRAASSISWASPDLVQFVVDDDANKAGKFMPGSAPSRSSTSQALVERDVKLCLFSVRPEIEEAVVKKNQAFLDQGRPDGLDLPEEPVLPGRSSADPYSTAHHPHRYA